ncbi:MAG: hypothetical protein R3E88_17200 [Myxococcota bacterium]
MHPRRTTWARATRALAVAALAGLLGAGCVRMQLELREPGEHNRGFPDDIADEYHCEKRPLPFFQVEETELLPERVSPGDEFNHRLQYVMCPKDDTQVVSGTLYTRILYKGKAILTESTQRDLQPGRWIVDSFITLPQSAEPGVYALQSEFKSKYGNFDSRATFLVED